MNFQKLNSESIPNILLNKAVFYSAIIGKLQESFQQYWHELVSTPLSISGEVGGNKLRTFALFKHTINAENYLNISNFEERRAISQFRISAHK